MNEKTESNNLGKRFARALGCAFRRNWTPIPFETGHSVHGKVDSRSEATHGVDDFYSRLGSSVNFGLSRRKDSPSRFNGWA